MRDLFWLRTDRNDFDFDRGVLLERVGRQLRSQAVASGQTPAQLMGLDPRYRRRQVGG